MGVEDVVVALIGKGGGSKQVIQAVAGLIGGGGVAGLVGQFTKAGHGDKAASWVGTGANQPVTGDQVTAALGADKVQEVAQQAGISQQQAADQLADAIPKVVNEVTPDGKAPEDDQLSELVGQLKGLLG